MKKYDDMETTEFSSDTEDDDASDVSGTVDDEMVEVADSDTDHDSDSGTVDVPSDLDIVSWHVEQVIVTVIVTLVMCLMIVSLINQVSG